MEVKLEGHSEGTPEAYARMGAQMDELIDTFEKELARALPGDAEVKRSAVAAMIECLLRSDRFKDISSEDIAMPIGLGFGTAVMKRGAEDGVLDLERLMTNYHAGFSRAVVEHINRPVRTEPEQ